MFYIYQLSIIFSNKKGWNFLIVAIDPEEGKNSLSQKGNFVKNSQK